MLDIITGFIVTLAIMYVLMKIQRATEPFDDTGYTITEAPGCLLNHRHLWVKTGEFPEVRPYDGGINFIEVFECPVCVNELYLPIPRVDTTERHKSIYDET